MSGPQPAKRFPRRLVPGADFTRMAWFPSYRAPHPSELLDPEPFTPPGPPPMTVAGRRLLDAVLAEPDVDAPRLAFADWLDAQGDPRGEFIRVQLELAARPTAALRRRDQELLLAHREEWVAPFAPWSAEDVVFRRGFAEAMSLAGRAFLSISEGLFRATPLRDVRLVAIEPYLGELANAPHLTRLERLSLSGNRIGVEGVRTLCGSPHLGSLSALDLSRNDLGPEGVRVLRESGPARLRSLALAGNGLDPAAVRELLSDPRFGALTELDLSENPLGPELANVLPQGIEHLALGMTGLGAEGVKVLASRGLRPVELDLSFNDLGDAVPAGLTARARVLNLRGNRMTGVAGLRCEAVERLDLSVNPIGDDGAIAVVSSEQFGNLIDLSLANVQLTAGGVERLAASGALGGLERLDVGGNRIGDAGVQALAGCADLAGLRELDLTATDLGFAGAVALIRSANLTSLRVLAVGLNPRLPGDGVSLLRSRFPVVRG